MNEVYGKITKYLKGIYGMDTLSCGLVFFSLIFSLIRLVLPGEAWWSVVISIIFLLVCGFRFFSTRIDKRRGENEVFCRFVAPLFERLGPADEEVKEERARKREEKRLEKEKKTLQKVQEREFRFFNCPICKQKLRVPRGNGKVEITCPNCGNRFIRKT